MNFETFLLGLLIALSFAITIGFFWGRRTNAILMKSMAKELELALKPKDQLYTFIGGVSGFKASYKLEEEHLGKIEATLALLPRQSPVFYPISKVAFKHDRLYLIARLNKKPKAEFHLVSFSYYPVVRGEIPKLEIVREINVSNHRFRALSSNEDFLRRTLGELQRQLQTTAWGLRHFAINKTENLVYVFCEPRQGSLAGYVNLVREAAASAK